MNDPLGQALGIAANTVITANTDDDDLDNLPIIAAPREVLPNTQLEDDYTFVRTNLYDALTKGANALDELCDIAKQSQHPRTYEVLAGLIKTLGETNQRVMDLHKDMAELQQDEEDIGKTSVHVANAIFVGTTSELLEMTRKQRALTANNG
jgi:hypothetical protein